uniref:Ig-like domain-containing protein n=1 Tax=Oncorhynchus kisutch TaxID=8019 RepID=A0A8C7JCZ0_ONCKI
MTSIHIRRTMMKLCLLYEENLSSVWSTFTLGDTVDLECFITVDDDDRTSPRCHLCILTAIVFGEFDKKLCFATRKSGTRFVLTISDSTASNMGMYYCAAIDYESMIFGSCVFLKHQGTSDTFSCRFQDPTCAGEQNVYWFRHGSGESRPGIIYTNRDRSDQCEKSPEAGSPTQSCVYNLPKRNLILSDAGTCYCAVASCGEILFGNGTKLDVEDGDIDPQMTILVLLSIIRTGVLLCCPTIFITYTMK